ncbi:COBRA1 domain containing protein [Trichuris trichiura]|uniref:COBRA1 domain containing protein n=1 Tax=Trichuris trichiura TaxID=36087 RepID=A0A077Z688_TRITR|nr:COBRA1 domain containing protein [Trichuris trichiura]
MSNSTSNASVFENFGLASRNTIVRLLRKRPAALPLAAIEQFREENGIHLPTLSPRLSLVDLIECSRGLYYESMLHTIRDRLLNRLEQVKQKRSEDAYQTLLEPLNLYLALNELPVIRPVVVAAIEAIPNVPQFVIDWMYKDKTLYEAVNTEVKQQLWNQYEDLFYAEAKAAMIEYAEDRLGLLRQMNNAKDDIYQLAAKVRRNRPALRNIMRLIGKHIALYDLLLSYIRAAFVHTRSTIFCTLRADLCMAIHDMDIKELIKADPCYSFVCIMDAFIRDRQLDSRTSMVIKKILRPYFKRGDPITGDFSMISNDISCVRALSQQIIRGLQQCVAKGSLPRQLKILHFLIRLLNLGVTGWKFDHEKRRLASAIKPQTFTDFLTSLCTCKSVAQSTALLERVEASKRVALKQQLVEIEAITMRRLSAELCRSKLNGIVYMFFVLDLLKTRKLADFLKHFELLIEHRISLVDEEPYLHMFVSSLSLIPEAKWRSTGIFELLFSRYFLVSPLSHVRIHGIRLAACIAPCLTRDQLAVLVDKLQPRADEDELALAYDDFVAKLGSDFFEKLPESKTAEDKSALLNQWGKLTGLLNECE